MGMNFGIAVQAPEFILPAATEYAFPSWILFGKEARREDDANRRY